MCSMAVSRGIWQHGKSSSQYAHAWFFKRFTGNGKRLYTATVQRVSWFPGSCRRSAAAMPDGRRRSYETLAVINRMYRESLINHQLTANCVELPLKGIVVLEFSQLPFRALGGLRLADLGARDKIEQPGSGDAGKNWPLKIYGWMKVHCFSYHQPANKESFAADLKNEEDIAGMKNSLQKPMCSFIISALAWWKNGVSPEFWSRNVGWYMMCWILCQKIIHTWAIKILNHLTTALQNTRWKTGVWWGNQQGQPGKKLSGVIHIRHVCIFHCKGIQQIFTQHLPQQCKRYKGLIKICERRCQRSVSL